MNETTIKLVNSDEQPQALHGDVVTLEQAKQKMVEALNNGADTIVIAEEHDDTAEEVQ